MRKYAEPDSTSRGLVLKIYSCFSHAVPVEVSNVATPPGVTSRGLPHLLSYQRSSLMEAILAFVPEEDRSGEPGAGGVFLRSGRPEAGEIEGRNEVEDSW